MKISYDWLSSYFKKPLIGGPLPRPEKLAELFNAHFAEVEGVEKVGEDTVLDLKTLADRNHYALSHLGVAVEAGAILKKDLVLKPPARVAIDASVPAQAVEVRDEKLCRRYMARRIEGVTVGSAPAWLRRRLEAIGARSINSVVDAGNYVMFDKQQPLHAFDADKVRGSIVVRRARAGERMTLLDGREVELREGDLLIADEEGPLVIAGVKGGKRAEVTESTRNLIIESANFDPTAVRRTATRLNIRNDSSKRFENDLSPHIANQCLEEVTALILEMSGGKAGPITDIYPSPAQKWTIEADPAQINAVTGLSLPAEEMVAIFRRLWCEVVLCDGRLFVTPPYVRQDLAIAEDLADEIGRIHGYDRLEARQTPDVPPTPIDKAFYWSEKAKNILVGLGFSETLLYTLVPKGSFEVSYPLASDKSALREAIAPKLKESLAMNARNAELLGLETVRAFEIGKVFPAQGERASLCLGVCQIKKKKGVTSESLLRESLEALKAGLGAAFEVRIETGAFGVVAEVDFDAVVANLPAQGALADLSFVRLPRDQRYKPFSPYPFIARDIALFVPSGTADSAVSSAIAAAARDAAGKLLVKGPDQFDRFEKEGRVSYAFRMVFQSFEKTLSDDEANAFMAKVYEAAKGKGWEVR
ncbi:MAG TPA: phenylalanine--tRNA ligase subunit beta [Candidatus Paceibacterota bacterium]|nr:phenylalanine--tRNA ligase subunit beta [Candidatus Paceibacterota bacterium]